MVYYMATQSKTDEFQPKIIKFLRRYLYDDGFNIKIVKNPRHIIESHLPKFEDNDILIWHPNVAANNLDIVKENSSFVILQNKTILIQKISERNPINENLAINCNFRILYIDEDYDDITNAEWKLAVSESNYRISQIELKQLLKTK